MVQNVEFPLAFPSTVDEVEENKPTNQKSNQVCKVPEQEVVKNAQQHPLPEAPLPRKCEP
jgi:hypothetical protein